MCIKYPISFHPWADNDFHLNLFFSSISLPRIFMFYIDYFFRKFNFPSTASCLCVIQVTLCRMSVSNLPFPAFNLAFRAFANTIGKQKTRSRIEWRSAMLSLTYI